MAYCTTAQVDDLLADVGNFQTDTELDVSARIEHAERWVDSYLSGAGYDVPFADGSVPELVQEICATYTCYLILRRPNWGGQFTDEMREFRGEARRLIDDVLDGKADLIGVDIEEGDEDRPNPTAVSNPHGAPRWRHDKKGKRIGR